MEETQQITPVMGYMDNSNCVMSNRTLHNLSYNEELTQTKKPELVFNSRIKLRLSDLMNVLKSASHFGESIKLSVLTEPKTLQITTKNDLNQHLTIELPLLELEGGKIADSVCLYSIEFLKQILKEFTTKEVKCLEVVLSFSSDYPLMLEINDLWVILAPRVNNE